MPTRNVLGEEVKAIDTKHAELFAQDNTQETQYSLYKDTIYADYVYTQEELQKLKEEAESGTNISGSQEATLALIRALNNTKPYEAEIKKGIEIYNDRKTNPNVWSDVTGIGLAGFRLFTEVIDYLGTLNIGSDKNTFPNSTYTTREIPNHAVFFADPRFQRMINYPKNAYENSYKTQGFDKFYMLSSLNIINTDPTFSSVNEKSAFMLKSDSYYYIYIKRDGGIIKTRNDFIEFNFYSYLTRFRELLDWTEYYIVYGYLRDWSYTGHQDNFTKEQQERYMKLEIACTNDRNWIYYNNWTKYIDLTKTFYTLDSNNIGDIINVQINQEAINSFLDKFNEFRARIDLLPQSLADFMASAPPYIILKDILEKELKIPSVIPTSPADKNKIIFGFSEESCADLLYFQDFLEKNGLLDKIPALKIWTPKSEMEMGDYDCVRISSFPYYLYAYAPQKLMSLDNVFLQYVIKNYLGALSDDEGDTESSKFNTYEALKEYLQKLPYLYNKRIELLRSKKQELLNSIEVYYNGAYSVATHEQKADLKEHYDKFLETIDLEETLVSDVLDKNQKMLDKLQGHIENGDGITDSGNGDIDIDFDNKLPTITKQFWQVNSVSLIVGTPKKVYTKDKDSYTPIENANIGYSKADKLYCIEYTITAKAEGVFNFEIQLGDQKQALEVFAFSQDTIDATLAHYSKKMFYYAKFGIGNELQGTMVYKQTESEKEATWESNNTFIIMPQIAFVSSESHIGNESPTDAIFEYSDLDYIKQLKDSGNVNIEADDWYSTYYFQYIPLSDRYKEFPIEVTHTNGIFLTLGLLLKNEYDEVYHKEFLKNNFVSIYNFMKNTPIQAFMCYKLEASLSDSWLAYKKQTYIYAVVYEPKEIEINQTKRIGARVKVFKEHIETRNENHGHDKLLKANINEFNSLGNLDNFVTQHIKEYANVYMNYAEEQRPTDVKLFPYHINTTNFVNDIINDPNIYKHTESNGKVYYIRFFAYENDTPTPIKFSDSNKNSELTGWAQIQQLNFKHSFSKGVRKAYIVMEIVCTKIIGYNYPDNFSAIDNETRYTFDQVSVLANQVYGENIYKTNIFINNTENEFAEMTYKSIEKESYGIFRIYEISISQTGTFKQAMKPILYSSDSDTRLFVLHLTFS